MKRFAWTRSDASAGPPVAAPLAFAPPAALEFPRADASVPTPPTPPQAPSPHARRVARVRSVATVVFGGLLLLTVWVIGVSYFAGALGLAQWLHGEERARAARSAAAVEQALRRQLADLQAAIAALQADAALARAASGGAAAGERLASLRQVHALSALALLDEAGAPVAVAGTLPQMPARGEAPAIDLHAHGSRLLLTASAPLQAGPRVAGWVAAARELDAEFFARSAGVPDAGVALVADGGVLLATAGAPTLPSATIAAAAQSREARFLPGEGDGGVIAQPVAIGARAVAVVAPVAGGALQRASALARGTLVPVALLTLAAALLLGAALARTLIGPIRRLTERAEELSLRHAGRSVARGGNEFDTLVAAFDAMTEALLGHSERLKRAHLNELQNSLELQRQYALMRLLRGLAAAANESDSVQAALQRSVHEIGEYLDWPLGRAVLAPDGPAAGGPPRSLWFARDPDRHAGFIADSERCTLGQAIGGLIGDAWAGGMPHWISDLTRLPESRRRDVALAAGLRSAVVIPVIARGHVSAFIEFFSDHRVEATAEMLELVEAIGIELSRLAERHRNERDLRASEREARRLAMVTAHTEKFVAICDARGRLQWVNDAVLLASGRARDELIGRLPQALLTGPDTDPAVIERLAAALAAGAPCRAEIALYDREGRRMVHEVEGVPLLDRGGRLEEYAFISTDVTAARRTEAALRSSEMYFRALFDRSPVPASIQDAQLRLVRVNDAYARLLGRRAEDLLGRDPVEFVDPDDRAQLLARRAAPLAVGASADYELRLRGADDAPRAVRVHVAALQGADGQTVFLTVLDDISDLKANERMLREARDLAESASRAKSQFLANMSHEIRTPMNGVLGMTELLLGTPLTDRQRRFAEAVYRSGECLLQIINDILDFSKIEAGRMELESVDFDLRGLIEDVFDLLSPRAADKRLELACRIDPAVPGVVRGDPVRLRQVLTNLVGNAIKFTEQGEVLVQVTARGRGCTGSGPACGTGHHVFFEVRDTGIGIAPESLERLFSSFMQADQSMSRRYGGTGLGLAISKQLVELMGGSISADSVPGQGSTFRFDICLGDGDPARVRADGDGPAHARLAGARVLVVEDNPTNRSILEQQLRGFGVTCASAEHGAAALDLLRAAQRVGQHFDIAIVDLKMPGMDGLTLAATLRRDPAFARLGIILLTSLAEGDELRDARRAGVDVHLAKPVRQRELLAALASLRARAGASAPALPGRAAAGARRVLLVEDNPVNQEVARAMLGELGCEVSVASDGQEGLALLARERFDLVLMDCQMPGMDGFEALRRLRDAAADRPPMATAREVPVIALTANALAGDAERCLAAGFDDYLPKPVRQQQLALAIARACGGARDAAADGPVATAAPGAVPQEEATMTEEPTDPGGVAALDPAVIDRIRAMERRGAARLLQRLIATYRDSAARLVADAGAALNAGDAGALRHAAHTLKSSSANVGASVLAERAAALEAAARDGDLARCGALWPAVCDEHRRAARALRQLAQDEANGP